MFSCAVLGHHVLEERDDVAARTSGWRDRARWREDSTGPMMVTPWSTTVSPGLVSFAIAAALGRQIDDHRTGGSSRAPFPA